MGNLTKETVTGNDRLGDEEVLMELYEAVRAAEMDSSREALFTHASMEVSLDWKTLEERAAGASMSERLLDVVTGWSAGAIARSGLIPSAFIVALFLFLRRLPVTWDNSVYLVLAFVLMGLMLLWVTIAARALWEVIDDRWETAVKFTANFAVAAAVVYVSVNLRPSSNDPHELTRTAAVASVNNDTAAVVKAAEEVSEQTTPAKDPDIWFMNAEVVYRQVMRMSPHNEEEREEMAKLAQKAIDYLSRAAQANPDNASVWTRLAELHYLQGNTKAARAAIERVNKIPDIPANEHSRARLIAGYINAQEIGVRLASAEGSEHSEIAKQIDTTIAEVSAVKKETGADASQLLTHLYLQRAALAETGDERRSSAQNALRESRDVISSPSVSLRTVDPPSALAAQTTFQKPSTTSTQ